MSHLWGNFCQYVDFYFNDLSFKLRTYIGLALGSLFYLFSFAPFIDSQSKIERKELE